MRRYVPLSLPVHVAKYTYCGMLAVDLSQQLPVALSPLSTSSENHVFCRGNCFAVCILLLLVLPLWINPPLLPSLSSL